MNASTIVLMAIVLALIGRWSHNEPTVSAKLVVEAVFVLVVIAMLDQGQTQGVAQGFAWLIFAAVILSKNSPLTGIAKVVTAK